MLNSVILKIFHQSVKNLGLHTSNSIESAVPSKLAFTDYWHETHWEAVRPIAFNSVLGN